LAAPPLRRRSFGEHDEGGQVLVFAPQAVGEPGPDGRVAAEPVPRVHVVAGRRVVDALGLATAIDTQLVGHAGEVLEVFAHFQAGLADLTELERARHVVPLAARHGRGEFVFAGELRHVEFGQLGLGIERVDVAGAPFEEEQNAGLGLGRVMGGLRSERAIGRRLRLRRASFVSPQ
jgi:hypothetical protein